LQARNEFENLEKGRAVLPDNVVNAQAPADPRQGWIVKEKVVEIEATTAQNREGIDILQKFIDAGVNDASGNMMFGTTVLSNK